MNSNPRQPVTAREFFAAGYPSGSKQAAHRATGISYSTICSHCSKARTALSARTALRLQEWSLTVDAAHGVYISAAQTVGLSEPRGKAAA